VSSEEYSLAADTLLRWVALDAPLDTLTNLEVVLNAQLARGVAPSVPDEHFSELLEPR
jgi:hypothetical protein